MSLKQELETNIKAVAAYDEQDYETALECFQKIQESGSKIRFNIGLIHATLGDHDLAIEQFRAALQLDRFLAVAHFQLGVSFFLVGDYSDARDHFNEALLYLRGNNLIDYEQLGMKFRLYSCEVLFNRGLSAIYCDNVDDGLADLSYAAREKQTEDHDVIDEALGDQGEGYTVFSIPVGVLYRPDESKVRNMAVRDYLGKAKLIASTNATDVGTGFRGYESQKRDRFYSTPQATMETKEVGLAFAMPSSQYVLPPSKDMQFERVRNMSLPGFDFDVQSRPSIAPSTRGLFPPPTRKNSAVKRTPPELPPTPPPDSRNTSRKGSSVSGASSVRSFGRQDSVSSTSARSPTRRYSRPLSPKSRGSSIDSGERVDTTTRKPSLVTPAVRSIRRPPGSDLQPVPRSRKDSDASVYEEIPIMIDRRRSGGLQPSIYSGSTTDSSSISSKSSRSFRSISQRRQDIEEDSEDGSYRRPRASEPSIPEHSKVVAPTSRSKSNASAAAISPRTREGDERDDARSNASITSQHQNTFSKSRSIRDTSLSSSSDYEGIVDDYKYPDPAIPRHSPPDSSSRVPVPQKIKCRIYGLEDTRVMMIESSIKLRDFQDRLASKFGWSKTPKLRYKDEDDEMVLFEDQEDLDGACAAAVAVARRAGQEVGKMEIWVKEERMSRSRRQ